MGLSYNEWISLYPDRGREHPDHPSNRAGALPPGTVAGGPVGLKLPKLNAKGQNKTEALFDSDLAAFVRIGDLTWYAFEPIKLRLAGNTSYRIDFLARTPAGRMIGFEVKGHMRDDAAIKIKVAAEQHPWLDLYLVRRSKREWDVRLVTRTGIGREAMSLNDAIQAATNK